jgi:hypothetical protein
MVSSVLRPEKIVGRQNTNRAAAQNFISGGSVLGASVINGAANKIVGFQRAGVQPAAPVVNNIVSTITTNINNNVTNVINKTLQGFSADYQRRLKQVDDAKPIGILGKFLNFYKTALGFINFFGNKKNINKVRDNLEVLKKSFTESFEVAKLIRQVIIKIVKQLSNLPVASPSGGGGLNLDVDIPGGGLRKSAPRGLQRMMGGKGKMLALGAGALGLGALGAGAVNALSDSPQDQAQAAQTSPEIPGDVVDKFSSIVDRFANAISAMFKTQKDKPKGSPGGGGGGSRSPGGPSPGGPSPNPNLMGGPGIEGLASFVAGAETGGRFDAYNADLGKGDPKILDTNISNLRSYISKYPNSSGAVGAYQFMPETAEGLAKQMGIDPTKTKFTPEVQKQLHLFHLNQLGYGKYVKGEMSKEDFGAAIAQQYRAVPNPRTGYTWNDSAAVRNKAQVTNEQYLRALEQSKQGAVSGAPPAPVLPSPTPKPGVGGPDLPDLMLSPQKREELKLSATTVSQPPPSQQQQQPIIMPINLGGGGQQQSGGGGMSGPPPSQGSGPSVPFLPAGNPDNFLVLYSRMVYNIVDG